MTLPTVAYIVLAIAVVVAVLVGMRNDRSLLKKINKQLSERRQLDPTEFGETYFPPEEKAIASQVRTILAAHYRVEAAGLLPNDNLNDLQLHELDSMAFVEAITEIEKRYEIKIPDKSAQELRTIADVVTFIRKHAHHHAI